MAPWHYRYYLEKGTNGVVRKRNHVGSPYGRGRDRPGPDRDRPSSPATRNESPASSTLAETNGGDWEPVTGPPLTGHTPIYLRVAIKREDGTVTDIWHCTDVEWDGDNNDLMEQTVDKYLLRFFDPPHLFVARYSENDANKELVSLTNKIHALLSFVFVIKKDADNGGVTEQPLHLHTLWLKTFQRIGMRKAEECLHLFLEKLEVKRSIRTHEETKLGTTHAVLKIIDEVTRFARRVPPHPSLRNEEMNSFFRELKTVKRKLNGYMDKRPVAYLYKRAISLDQTLRGQLEREGIWTGEIVPWQIVYANHRLVE